MAKPKAYHESFARFFEEPSREGFRELIKNNVGELRTCDFKAEWPDNSAVAKHLLGMANTGGGCIVVGVKENEDNTLEPSGLAALKDKADITNGIKNYLPNTLLNVVDVADFSFDASEYPKLVGKKFQVVFVEYNPTHIPFLSLKAGTNIKANAVYVRREGVTEEANHEELQRVINSRIETGYSTRKEIDLKLHLEQLRILYTEVPKLRNKDIFNLGGLTSMMGVFAEKNPNYPQEDFEKFVSRMIQLKKKRISEELDITGA